MNNFRSKSSRLRLLALLVLAGLVLVATNARAQPALGSSRTFAVLGASTVTNTGQTLVTGDVGVSPGTAITGFPPGIVTGGTLHPGDAVAAQAHDDAALAYAGLVALPCGTNLSGTDLGGMTLGPGVYCFNSSAQLTGVLTLDAHGDANALFVFQIGSTLTTASNAAVVVINPGQGRGCAGANVFWQVGSSATLGTDTHFTGHVFALISATVTTGVSVSGSVFALTGAVTLDTNLISVCSADGGVTFPPRGGIKVTGGGQIPVPSPDAAAANASGPGRATFGFNAQPDRSGAAGGHFNYVNHVTGLHVDGPVTAIEVIAVYPDGSPRTVRFSGVCEGVPACSFSVLVEDRGEPGTADRLGVTIAGDVIEARSLRVIARGNIQFHAK
jgi:hypothetical protein